MTDVQYGFRQGRGTTEQCLNLYLLVSNYNAVKRGAVHLDFMNLISAFDRVNRSKLWAVLGSMGVNVHILKCTKPFKLRRGVRQGCIMAPFLFILYINQVEGKLIV